MRVSLQVDDVHKCNVINHAFLILPCSDESWCLITEEEEEEACQLHGEQESEGLAIGQANLNWKIITNAD